MVYSWLHLTTIVSTTVITLTTILQKKDILHYSEHTSLVCGADWKAQKESILFVLKHIPQLCTLLCYCLFLFCCMKKYTCPKTQLSSLNSCVVFIISLGIFPRHLSNANIYVLVKSLRKFDFMEIWFDKEVCIYILHSFWIFWQVIWIRLHFV